MADFKNNLLKMRKIFTFSPFEKVLLLFVKGSTFQGFLSKLIPPPDLYTSGSMRQATTDGIKFELDNSCLMQWYVYWGLRDKTRDSLYSLIKPGDVVLDVGTNVGETLLNFARLVGPLGFAYGFEPDERNFRSVSRNIELNEFKNLRVFNLGVSDSKQTLKLFRV
ncbi:MAG: FkbM family methyltransferase, partial [Pyrinomonadaceae bacterium]